MVLQFLVKSLNLVEQNVLDFADQPTSGSAESCNQGSGVSAPEFRNINNSTEHLSSHLKSKVIMKVYNNGYINAE